MGDDGGDGTGDLLQARNEASRRYVTLPPEFYVPDAQGGLHHADPALGIVWPLPVSELSARDAA